MTLSELREAILKLSEPQLAELAALLNLDWSSLGGLGIYGKSRDLLERARARRSLPLVEEFISKHTLPAPQAERAGEVADASQGSAAKAAQKPIVTTTAVASGEAQHAQEHVAPQGREPQPHIAVARRSEMPLWLVALIGLLLVGTIGLLIWRRALPATIEPSSALPSSGIGVTPSAIPTMQRLPSPVLTSIPEPTATQNSVPTAVAVVAIIVTPLSSATPPAALNVSTPTLPMVATVAALVSTVRAVDTPAPAPTQPALVSTVRADDVPAPTSTATPAALPKLVGEPDSPMAFVNVINQQVTDYLQGRVTVQDLSVNWQGTAYTGVQRFLDQRVTASLALAPRDGKSITSTMRYLSPPDVHMDPQGNATVRVREGWKYGSRITGKTACETRDYFYRFVKVEGRYKVDEFSGAFVDAKCFE